MYFCDYSVAPKIDKMLCQSNSYTSVELEVILQYTGGQPIIEFMIRFRVVNTTGWSSMVVPANHSNGATPWYHSLTDLRFDQRGYEVEATATNAIGSSNLVTSSPAPITLYTGTHTYMCILNVYVHKHLYVNMSNHISRLTKLNHYEYS